MRSLRAFSNLVHDFTDNTGAVLFYKGLNEPLSPQEQVSDSCNGSSGLRLLALSHRKETCFTTERCYILTLLRIPCDSSKCSCSTCILPLTHNEQGHTAALTWGHACAQGVAQGGDGPCLGERRSIQEECAKCAYHLHPCDFWVGATAIRAWNVLWMG